MELMNKDDIRQYVHDPFMGESSYQALVQDGEEGAGLVREIIEASQGVFFWVVLVVRSFRDGLINGDHIEDLRVRLGLLPRDLNEYFDKILLSDVDEFYRPQASRMFKVAVGAHLQLPCMAYWFLGTKINTCGFEPGLVPLDVRQFSARMAQLRKILNACTKGLLEVRRGGQNDINSTGPLQTVDFLHRTVRDYLLTPETQNWLNQWGGGTFNVDMAICNALLAQLKTAPRVYDGINIFSFGRVSNLFTLFFHHVERLDKNPDCEIKMLEMLLRQFDNALAGFGDRQPILWYRDELDKIVYETADDTIPTLANVRLTLLGIKFCLNRYVTTSLDSNLKRQELHKYLPALLRYAVINGQRRIDNHQMVRSLLQSGINPNERVSANLTGSNWTRLLGDIWASKLAWSDSDDTTTLEEQLRCHTQLCLQFLEHGADCHTTTYDVIPAGLCYRKDCQPNLWP